MKIQNTVMELGGQVEGAVWPVSGRPRVCWVALGRCGLLTSAQANDAGMPHILKA